MPSDPILMGEPINLILAADLSQSTAQPWLDAVWQFSLEPTKPLLIETNLGLQVKALRIFPAFLVNNRPIIAIEDLFARPIVEKWLPNYLSLRFYLQQGLAVKYELMVETPQDLLGRITFTNEKEQLNEFGVRIAGDLFPLESVPGFIPAKFKYQNFLRGHTGQLDIALWLGQPSTPVISPHSALFWSKALVPGESACFRWQCGFFEPSHRPIEKFNFGFPDNWDERLAEHTITISSSLLEVETGNPEIDLTIRASQYLAKQLSLPNQGLCETRTPSLNASSILSRGQDLNAQVSNLWQIIISALTIAPEKAQLMLQQAIIAIDGLLKDSTDVVFPLLSRLTWSVFQHTHDREFLNKALEPLYNMVARWFDAAHDQDQDGLPEWSNIGQTQFRSSFAFSLLQLDALPSHIANAENIALGTLLRAELKQLHRIASALEDASRAQEIIHFLARLELALTNWSVSQPELSWRDALTHQFPHQKLYFQAPHQSARKIQFTFEHPLRLNLILKPSPQTRRPASIILAGINENGQAIEELLTSDQFTWLPGFFYASSASVYTALNGVSVDGLEFAELLIYSASLPQHDFSALFNDLIDAESDAELPVLANWLAEADQTQFGLPEQLNSSDESGKSVNLFWHSLLIAELIRAEHKELAWLIFEKLLKAQMKILKTENALFGSFTSDQGKPIGSRNTVQSLIPLELLMEIAGVKIYSSHKVSLGGENGLTAPITFRFQGLEVRRDGKNGFVRMPDGSEFHHFGSVTRLFQID